MLGVIKRLINRLLSIGGFELRRTTSIRLYQAFQKFNIDTVLDVGANTGQFVNELRRGGFQGRIISFEPLLDAHKKISNKARKDSNWKIHTRGALGDYDGHTTINISANSVSSSILEMNSSHSSVSQDSKYIGSETISINKLDTIVSQYLSDNNKVFLKIDTQGFEWQVLDGAVFTLPNIQGILLETSLIELYKGQYLWRDMIDRLEGEGFTIWSIERGFTDPNNGRTLQCDIVFFRVD